MSRRNYVEDKEYGASKGMDSTSALASIPPGYVQYAYNANILPGGGYEKRRGYTTQLSSAWTGRTINGGFEYRDSAGVVKIILHGADGTDGRFGYINSGAVTDILTGLTKTARPSFVQFRDLLFFYNGADTPKVYDGTSTRQIGITAPATAPSISQGTTGSLTQTGTYIWAYTYYNTTTGAESSPSALSASTTLTGANDDATLTISAGSATTADKIRIYRTFPSGNELFLEDTIAVASTTHVSTKADSALTNPTIEFDNTRIPDLSTTAKYPVVAQNRIFLRTADNAVRWSKLGQGGAMPESYEIKATADTMGTHGNNDKILGLSKAGDTPIVLKQRSVGRLEGIGFPDPSLGVDQQLFLYRESSASTGAVSHWAATTVYGECIFLSRDNIYATDGVNPSRPIANSIQSTIKALSFTSAHSARLSAENDTKNKRVIFSVFASGIADAASYQLVGDYRSYPEFSWTIYREGATAATHPGLRPECLFTTTNTTDGTLELWFGNADLNGQVYQMNDGTNDNVYPIYFKIAGRPMAGGNTPNLPKLFKHSGIHVSGDGNNYNLTVSAIYDLGTGEANSRSISLANSGDLWDNANWDSMVWADSDVQIKDYAAHRKAKFQQLVFTQTGADAPVSILGWVQTGSLYRAL